MNKNNQNKEFLQSSEWRNFQTTVGRKTFHLKNEGFSASIVEHVLLIVGKYFYCPRGPITSLKGEEFPISNFQFPNKSQNSISNDLIKSGMRELVGLAKKENAGWIRIDVENIQTLDLIKENITEKIVKAPHDMQPKEVFVIDISKSADQLLLEMKPKTRYNIKLAEKKGVVTSFAPSLSSGHSSLVTGEEKNKYIEAFLRLTKEMAARQGITAHDEKYYRRMIESLPEEMLQIYVAEFEGKIIAANLMLFYEETATYLHGASSNVSRNVMAPFLLQWQAILDAKEKGCVKYDFGGVKITDNHQQATNNWEGITNFKLGFSPNTKPIEFLGSYDIIINPRKYAVYRGLQRAKAFAARFRK